MKPKVFALLCTIFLFSLTWAQPKFDGMWLGKIEDEANPCRQLYLKLELEQNVAQLSGKLFFKDRKNNGYKLLGTLSGKSKVTASPIGFEWELQGDLKAHPSLPRPLVGAVNLSARVIVTPPDAPPSTLKSPASAFVETPSPMSFVQTDTEQQTNENLYFDSLEFVWAFQHLNIKQLERLSRLALEVGRNSKYSMAELDNLATQETLRAFQASCKKRKAG